MPMSFFKGVMKAAVSALLLLLVLRKVNLADFLNILAGIRYGQLIIPFLLFVFLILLRTFRWKLIIGAQPVKAGFLKLLYFYYLSEFFNLFLPSRFGGDIVRMIKVGQGTKEKIKTGSSVIYERIVMITALMTVFLLSTIAGWRFINYGPAFTVIGVLLGATFILLGVLYAPFWGRRGPHQGAENTWRGRFAFWGVDSIARHLRILQRIREAVRMYAKDRRIFYKVFLLSLGDVGMIILIYYVITRILLFDISLGVLFIVIPVVIMMTSIPVSFNGLGVRESTMAVMLAHFNIMADQAVMLALTFYGLRVLHSLIGGILFFL